MVIRAPDGVVPVKGCAFDTASGLPMEVICEKDGAPMVLVPAGEFLMGSRNDDLDADRHETPQRLVYLDGFYIDKYPVTNEQYRMCIQATGLAEPEYWGEDSERSSRLILNEPMQPVVGVTWAMARDYCKSVGKRLPTEAEWEKAARGVDGRKHPWGNKWDGEKVIWEETSGGKTHPVDRDYNTHQSPFGAVDMVGNTFEWVSDWYGSDYYRNAPDRNPKGPASGTGRVVRGGSFNLYDPVRFRATFRFEDRPDDWYLRLGFRCAKAP